MAKVNDERERRHRLHRNEEKKNIPLRISQALTDDISKALARTGYHHKQRSFWVEESLIKMATNPEWVKESVHSDRRHIHDLSCHVWLSAEGQEALTHSCLTLRSAWAMVPGVVAIALRGAMRFRLRHPELFSEY